MKALIRRTLFLAALLPLQGTVPAQSIIAIEGVTLIDGKGGPPRPNITILIEGNRFRQVASCGVQIPTGATRIDGQGKFAIPGLMDMHVHIEGGRLAPHLESDDWKPTRETAVSALHSFLYSGVTSVYDAGGYPEFIFPLREEERSGELIAPRIFAAGYAVSAPGGHSAPPPITMEDWVRDRKKLDEVLARKPDVLKITQDEHGWRDRPLGNIMPLELLEKVIRYSHEHGIRTCIHTSNELRTWEAIYSGVDTLAHPILQGPVSERYLKMMQAKKIPQVSTLAIGDNYRRLTQNPEFLDHPLYQATLSQAEISRLKTEEAAEQANQNRTRTLYMEAMNPVAIENLRRLHEAGGIVTLGTDTDLGPAVHRELELLVEGGITPLDALTIATRNGAVFLGKEDEMGTVEAGKLADLVILDADPLADINNTKKVDTVIKNGQIINLSELQIPGNQESQ